MTVIVKINCKLEARQRYFLQYFQVLGRLINKETGFLLPLCAIAARDFSIDPVSSCCNSVITYQMETSTSFPLVRALHVKSLPSSSPLLSTLTDLIVYMRKKKTVSLHSECGCIGRWTRLKPKMTVGKLWWWIKKCVCVCVVCAVRCEWFPHKTLFFVPVYIRSLFQFWLLKPTCIQYCSFLCFCFFEWFRFFFFLQTMYWNLFSPCHCGICLLKRTRWALRVVACDFHK